MTSLSDSTIEGACASIGLPMAEDETFADWFERVKCASKLGNGRDYGIIPQPTTDRQALDWLADKALGPNWCVSFSAGRDQVNTCRAIDIAEKLCMRSCPFRKEGRCKHDGKG